MTFANDENKIKYILIEISKQKGGEDYLIELLKHSKFEFQAHWNAHVFPEAYNLEILITADIFTKNYSLISDLERIIKTRINNSTKLIIDSLTILPDYNKLELVNSQIIPVKTEWQEINELQQELIKSLQRSTTTTNYQNIGNSARIIMDKVARMVFDLKKHKPMNNEKVVHNGKFKNQLHSYIDTILSGEKNKEFRKLAKSAIDFVENSCDLMNTTTHKLDAERHLAEVCVISTVSAISIINLIRQLE